MGRYIVRRLVLTIPLLIGISFLVFAVVNVIPGDPISVMLGTNPLLAPDPAMVEQLRRQYGLDQPLGVQYIRFLGRLLHGDLGRSIQTQEPVLQAVLARLPATLQLAVAAMVVAVAIAVPAGVTAAARQHSVWDHAAVFGSLLGVSIPNFWLALLLMLIFSLELRWLPLSGMGDWQQGPGDVLRHLVLPAVTLGTSMAALLTRLTRSGMLEVLRQEYVRAARAKGLAQRVVIWRHGLRNALIPVVTVAGIQFGHLLGGSVIVETIFGWPGVGRLAVNAIWKRDLPVIQGTVLIFTLLFVLVNLAVDVLYACLDPRIRYE